MGELSLVDSADITAPFPEAVAGDFGLPTDLENQEVEVMWLEVCPFKSKPSLLIGSIYRPPSYTKADDLSLEANLERVYLLNKETIFLGDVNIDGRNKKNFDKHRLIKAVHGMNFTQLVNERGDSSS